MSHDLYIQEDLGLEVSTDFEADTVAARGLLERYAGIENDAHGGDTPKRFLRMLDEMTMCRDADDLHIASCIKWKDFPADDMQDMIALDNIPFVSVCNHHLLAFKGVAHIAYVPDRSMAGLSKFARVVKHFARQPQVQERMTKQIGDFLEEVLKPLGVGVILKAEHMCMTIRGVGSEGTMTTTSTMRGVFGNHSKTAKSEFLQIVNGR